MMEEVGECIWRVVGNEPGPTIVVFGGIHGNELTGIEVVKKIRDAIASKRFTIDRGTLYLILGNPRAIERNTRGSEDHADLNRCFKRDVLTCVPETYEQIRAQEIAKILATADVSIDLHATNKPSVPFLCCAVDEAHEKIYRWFDCDRVLTDPHYILANEPVTTDEFLDLHGGIGVCYETGFVGDVTRVESVYENVLNVLRDQKTMFDRVPVLNQKEQKQIFELIECIFLTEAGFRYEGNLGGGSFEEFVRGQTIGYVGNKPIVAEFDGVIIFPKLPEFQSIGKPVVYLAKRIL